MNILNKILLCFAVLFLENCTNHNGFITEHKDAWINDPSKGLVYCRANVKNNELADPVCFEAGFLKYEDGNPSRVKKE